MQALLPHWRTTGPETLARRVTRRVLALGVGIGVFVLVASVVEPRTSPAEPPTGSTGMRVLREATALDRDQVQRGLLALKHPKSWPSLGLVEGREYYLLIHGSPEGPRYTVCSLSGKIIQADLPADDVYRAFPSVDVEGMHLEPAMLPDGPALMLADPGVEARD